MNKTVMVDDRAKSLNKPLSTGRILLWGIWLAWHIIVFVVNAWLYYGLARLVYGGSSQDQADAAILFLLIVAATLASVPLGITMVVDMALSYSKLKALRHRGTVSRRQRLILVGTMTTAGLIALGVIVMLIVILL